MIPVQSTILGLLTAGVIVLLLRPVQRMAETFTNGIMRGVRDTPDYVESRKHQVYQAALEGAIEDGTISERERDILRRLREQLELPAAVAEELEAKMLTGFLGGR